MHYSCYWCTINSPRFLLGDCATYSDHIVIYGIDLDYDHEVKMQSRPQPDMHIESHAHSFGDYLGVDPEEKGPGGQESHLLGDPKVHKE